MLRGFVASTVLTAVVAVGACSGRSSSRNGDGKPTGGASGSGGGAGASMGGSSGTVAGRGGVAGAAGSPAGRGGTAGSSPAGGSAGAAPTGGAAGSSPSGGAAGSPEGGAGGTAGVGGGGDRECESADDCVLFSDCCSCMGLPAGSTPPYCDLVCITDRCTSQQIQRDEVTCSFGRCVIDRSCDHAKATCDSLPEPCPGGDVRALNDDGCFGPCLSPTECRDVTDCSACSDAVCVIEEPQIRTFGCVRPDDDCEKGSYCECLDACPTSGFSCTEAEDAVHCPCPVC